MNAIMKKCNTCNTTENIARGKGQCFTCIINGERDGDIIIGIDPDSGMSGYAEYSMKTKKLIINKFSFFSLLEVLSSLKDRIKVVVIEAGWLNKKSNFRGNHMQSRFVGEKIAKDVGSNHETGRKLVEMCKWLEIPFKEIKPLSTNDIKRMCADMNVPGREILKIKDKKIDADTFALITGYKGRTNQDKRDAAILILPYIIKGNGHSIVTGKQIGRASCRERVSSPV